MKLKCFTLLICVILSCNNCSRSEENIIAKVKALPVEVLYLQQVSSYQTSRYYIGEIIPDRASQLSFERSGKLLELFVEEGQQVVAKQILAILSSATLEAKRLELTASKEVALAQLQEMENGPRTEEIEALKAQVKNLNQQLQLANSQYSRNLLLYQSKTISSEIMDGVTSHLSSVKSSLQVAQRRLEILLAGTRYETIAAQKALVKKIAASLLQVEIDLSNSQLRAPYTGIISRRYIDEGTVVTSGQPIFRLLEREIFKVHIGISTDDVPQFPLDSIHRLQMHSHSRSYNAKVKAILPELDLATKTTTVVLIIEDTSAGAIYPGELVRLEVTSEVKAMGYWIPISALVGGNRGLWFCYVVKNSCIEKASVQIVYIKNKQIFIQGDLSPSPVIIKSGTHRLTPGQKVQILE